MGAGVPASAEGRVQVVGGGEAFSRFRAARALGGCLPFDQRMVGMLLCLRRNVVMGEDDLLRRVTVNPKIFGGKPIIRGRRLAVEHVLGMLAAGDAIETIREGYPWMEKEDVLACLAYARRLVAHERVEPVISGNVA